MPLKDQLPLPDLPTMMAWHCFLASEKALEVAVLPAGAGLSGTKGLLGLVGRVSGEQATEDSSEWLVFYKLLLDYVLRESFFFLNTVFLYAFCKVVLTVFVQEKTNKKKHTKTSCCKGLVYFERQVYLKFCI